MATLSLLSSPLSSQLVQQVSQTLQRGGVVVVPTDSFYALAVCPFNDMALDRLVRIKQERNSKPFPVLIGNRSQLGQLALEVPDLGESLMDKFWPGLLTLVFQARPDLPEALTGSTTTIGIRQPGNPLLCQLLSEIGPITGTSANRAGCQPLFVPTEVTHQLGSQVDLILDGGPTPGELPSTVLSLAGKIRILREGAIPIAAFHSIFGLKDIISS